MLSAENISGPKMSKEQNHFNLLIEHLKLSLLRDVPIDELPNQYVQDVVQSFREGEMSMIDALIHFEKIQDQLGAMVRVNQFLDALIITEEIKDAADF